MRQKRHEKLEALLGSLESEFRAKLIAALHRCQQGYWGLFDQNGLVDMPERIKLESYTQSGAAELDRLGAEINQVRSQLGMSEPFPPYARLLAARGRKTANDLGEPRLATLWLQELE